MRKLILVGLLLLIGCDPVKPLPSPEKTEFGKDYKLETQKHIDCIDHCKTQGMLVPEFGYNDCKCQEPLKNSLGECAKACGGKMKEATHEHCICLNPYEKETKKQEKSLCTILIGGGQRCE